MQEWNAGIQKGYRLSPLTFSGKVTNSANTEKHRETQDSRNPLQGRNDGRLMPGARRRSGEAVISLLPRCAAAVDHADTELIGHTGQLKTPGFFVVAAPTAPHCHFKSSNSFPVIASEAKWNREIIQRYVLLTKLEKILLFNIRVVLMVHNINYSHAKSLFTIDGFNKAKAE